MGVNISDITPKDVLKMSQVKNKVIAIDTYIELYDFLRNFPKRTDNKGRITTHLQGLLDRTVNMLSWKIKPCFIFDGSFPEVKRYPRISNDIRGPRITATITQNIVNSSMKLLKAMGLPIVQAPYESEAQAAYMVQRGDAWAVACQDFDSLIFGSPRIVMNLTSAKRRKHPSKGQILTGAYLTDLKKTLKKLKISQDQLIMLAMIVGTDFNPGIYDMNQKKALSLIKRYKGKEDFMFKRLHWNYAYPWKEMFYFLKSMPVTNKYKVKFGKLNHDAVKELLARDYGFDKRKVSNALGKI